MRIPYPINLLGLAVIIGVTTWVVSNLDPKIEPNLATGALITFSSRLRDSPDPQKLVDGDPFKLGFHSDRQALPWVQFDLQQEHAIQHVAVFNRLDCCSDRASPIELQLSHDGQSFETVASYESPFTLWKVNIPKLQARYVRLQLPAAEYLHLNEVVIR